MEELIFFSLLLVGIYKDNQNINGDYSLTSTKKIQKEIPKWQKVLTLEKKIQWRTETNKKGNPSRP